MIKFVSPQSRKDGRCNQSCDVNMDREKKWERSEIFGHKSCSGVRWVQQKISTKYPYPQQSISKHTLTIFSNPTIIFITFSMTTPLKCSAPSLVLDFFCLTSKNIQDPLFISLRAIPTKSTHVRHSFQSHVSLRLASSIPVSTNTTPVVVAFLDALMSDE